MRIVKRHAGGPENQVINFFRPYGNTDEKIRLGM